ncbi:MAG: hypothetical protein M3O36_17850 [Myxococcota bacterium]|nr:hypothetical protein [Myxococcota bacterium]
MVNALNRIWMARRSSALACFAMTVGAGCAARVYSGSAPGGVYPSTVEEDGVVYVDTVPPNIEASPRYAYGGGEVYYADGRWYRRGPRGWGYYRQEPPELARQRPSVVQAPAPAPPPAIPRERSDTERAPAAPHERQQEQPAHGGEVHHDRQDAERAPAAPHERSREDQAPAAPRPHSGAAEVAPHSGDAPRHGRPDDKPPPPQKEHER